MDEPIRMHLGLQSPINLVQLLQRQAEAFGQTEQLEVILVNVEIHARSIKKGPSPLFQAWPAIRR